MAWALALGALFSYGIEFLQLYFPPRDSGWEDVLTNATGSVAGAILFDLCGTAALRLLSESEKALEKLLPWPRASLLVLIYLALWFAISIPLQKRTRLSNWNPEDALQLGNSAVSEAVPAWTGRLFRLQVWNQALSAQVVKNIAAGEAFSSAQSGFLADYDFSASHPLQDQMHFLPNLSWAPNLAAHSYPPGLVLDGSSWLTTPAPISHFVTALRGTNQFAIRVVCSPATVIGIDAPIVSVSNRRTGLVDMEIGQQNSNLVVLFRNMLSGDRYVFFWPIRNVVVANRQLDILFSYDGSDASFYLGGKLATPIFHLGPAAALYRYLRVPTTAAGLDEYTYVYYFLIFFPAGILIGITERSVHLSNLTFVLFSTVSLLTAAWLLELILVAVSGRQASFAYVAISAVAAIGGSLWINAERRFGTS
jgi:VanZ family protein